MKKVWRIGMVVTLFVSLSLAGSCKKDKCGCDGAEKYKLTEEPGYLYYDKDTKMVNWSPKYSYGRFTICDPEAVWDQITQFDSGEDVLMWGSVRDDCMAQMNPQYYSGSYVLVIEKIKLNEFGH